MLESHLAGDFCLIGPKGCGKSTTVRRLADLLGYQVEPIVLYQASLVYLLLGVTRESVSIILCSMRENHTRNSCLTAVPLCETVEIFS